MNKKTLMKVALWSVPFIAGNYLTGFRFWDAVFRTAGK